MSRKGGYVDQSVILLCIMALLFHFGRFGFPLHENGIAILITVPNLLLLESNTTLHWPQLSELDESQGSSLWGANTPSNLRDIVVIKCCVIDWKRDSWQHNNLSPPHLCFYYIFFYSIPRARHLLVIIQYYNFSNWFYQKNKYIRINRNLWD